MRAALHPFFGKLPDSMPAGTLLPMCDVSCALRLRPEELDAAVRAGTVPAPAISRPGFRRWTAAAVREALRARQDSVDSLPSAA
jgi:hypothetical protein